MEWSEDGSPPYAAILHALPGFFAQITPTGRFLYLNRLAPGFSVAQVGGTTIYDFTPPAYHDRMRTCVEQVVATGAQAGFSSIAQGAHGQMVPYYTLIAPIGEPGSVTSLALLASDVTHVVEAHQALAATHAKLQLALDATGMGIWSYDPGREEVTWDAGLARLFGYAAEPRTHANPASINHVHPEDRRRVEDEYARLRTSGHYGPIEHRIIRSDGTTRWVSASGRVSGSGSATPATTVGSVVDITAHKLREHQLSQAQRLDSIGRLAGGVAHDFNNLLTAILSYTDLCIARAPHDPQLIADLHEIRRAGERSRELTSRLLMFARKQRVDPLVVDPNALVSQIDRLLERIVGEDIAITASLRATRNVRVDPAQLEQLLINLATNARDAMPRGGRLTMDTEDLDLLSPEGDLDAGPHVRIRITDTGVGIPPELLDHIFEPFVTTKDPDKGTGLGLAQCYGIARQHGGRLRLSSTVGVGTQITLDLPAVAEPLTPVPSPSGPASGGTETILLVEDEPLIRSLVTRLLGDEGYHVLAAANGEAALALAAQTEGTIHLLITDMVMPGMTGIELTDALRRTHPGTLALMMSGYAPQLIEGASGRIEFLAKPFLPDELLRKVRAVLGQEPVRPPGAPP